MVEAVESSIETGSVLPDKAPIRILLVDDKADFLKAAKACLEMQARLRVDTASSVEEATDKMTKRLYDAIVSDYVMPDKDGFTFLQELRAIGSNIPFIILTGKGREEIAIKALNLGADRYFAKAGDPETVYGELAHGIRQAVERRRAKEALIESEQKWKILAEQSPNMVFVNLKGKVVYANERCEEIMGYNREEFYAEDFNFLSLIAPESIDKVKANFNRHMQGLDAPPFEYTLVTKDGRRIEAMYSSRLIRYQGETAILGTIVDITQRKRMEKALRESEEKFKNIFESANDCIIYLDRSGRILDVNKKAVEVFGGSKKELLEKHLTKTGISSPRKGVEPATVFGKVITGRIPAFNIQIKNQSGQEIHLECSGSTMQFDDGSVGYLVVARNVTERKMIEEARRQADKELQKSEDRNRALLEETPIGICNIDIAGKITYVNKKFEEITGYSKGEVLGRNALSLAKTQLSMSRENMKLATKRIQEKFAGRTRPSPMQLRLRRKDGGVIWLEGESKVTRRFGVPVGLQAILTDITERKKSEEALKKSEEKFRKVVEHSFQGIVIVQDHRVVYANKAFAKITGFTVKELLSLSPVNVRRLVHPEDQALVWGRFKDRVKGKAVPMHYEYRGVRKDGKVIWLEIFAQKVEYNGKPAVQTAILDTTDRRKSEQELEQSRKHFQELFDAMVDPVVIVDGKGKILEVTRRVTEVTGFKREELVGKSFLRTKTMTAKSKAKTLKNLAQRMMGRDVKPYEVEVLTKDRRKLPYEINATRIEYKSKPADLVAFRDIAERKKMEEKLRVVGGLTRHDARNRLSTVTINAFLAKQKLPEDHEAQEHLSEIESACRGVEGIFDFARIYEKLGMGDLTYIDVEKALAETTILFSDLHDIKVINDCRGLTVLADSLLRQLFYNLIHNSLQHGERVTTIRVHHEETDGDRLKLVYDDDGVGIPKADKEKIFHEGWGKGTGYGLYLIRKMCEVYGWTIQETGKPSKGAQFTITIPKTAQRGKTKYRLRPRKN